MQITEVNDFNELANLRDIWNQLVLRCGSCNPFLTYEWSAIWWNHFGNDKKLLVLLIQEDGEVIAIAPLMVSKISKFMSIIKFIGAGRTIYQDLLISQKRHECLKCIFEYLENRGNWDYIELSNIPETSANVGLIDQIGFKRDDLYEKKVIKKSPYIRVTESWHDYFSKLPSKFRRDLLRRRQRIRKLGRIEFEVSHDVERDIHTFFQLSIKRHHSFSSQDWQNFHIDILKSFEHYGWVHLSFVKLNDVPIAATYGYQYMKTYYYYSTGFDTTYSKYGPGFLHQMCLFQDCFEKGFQEIDLSWGTQRYKLSWTPFYRNNLRYRFIHNNLLSRLKYTIGKKAYNIYKKT